MKWNQGKELEFNGQTQGRQLCKGNIWNLKYLYLKEKKMCPINSFIEIKGIKGEIHLAKLTSFV